MARVALTVTKSSKTGKVLPAFAAGNTGDGNTVPNSGKTLVFVTNSSVDTPYDVTIHVRRNVEGQNVAEIVKEIPFGQTWVFGPYDRVNYGDDLWINSENAALTYRVVEP